MRRYAPDRIRNVALVGHHGSGKTTLAEAMLHVAGATARRGRVEDGTTTCDHEPEEHRRGMSLSLALAPVEWRDHKVNLLDCPGEADCAGAVIAALSVADLAVVVVSATDGVEAQTEAAWYRAGELGVPRLLFVNKLDQERADFDRTLAALRNAFGDHLAVLELPIADETGLHGLVDVLSETADLYDGPTPVHGAEVPPALREREHAVHDQVVEEIVAGDDELLERFLADDLPSVAELEHALTVEMEQQAEVPVLCGSATTDVGVDRLLDYLVEIGPPPVDRPMAVQAGGLTVEVPCDPEGDPLAVVFHTIDDPYVGHLSLFRVASGSIAVDDHLTNARTGSDLRLHGLFTLRGKEHVEIDGIGAGDLGVAAKLAGTRTGDVLAPKGKPVSVERPALPEAVAEAVLAPATQSDDDKLGPALARLVDEDPSLVVGRATSGQVLLRGLGNVQLDVAVERLARRFGVHVEARPVDVAFHQTVAGTATVEARHKKQSGGHGQFAACTLRVEPGEPGSGLTFESTVVGGAISKSYIPAVRRGVEEAMADGGPAGHPVVDLKVTLLDGKEHSVDSSELAFKLAGRAGLLDALDKAGPVVLEPVAMVDVEVPGDLLGDVLGDLNSRRGKVVATTPSDRGRQVVSALVPAAELTRYPAELRSLTGGRGTFTKAHHHDQPVPDGRG